MAVRIFRQEDADLNVLADRTVAVIGYGNQGRAHALNLRDSGVSVLIGQRPGKGHARAVEDAFDPVSISEAGGADLVIVALPDEVASEAYGADIAGHLKPGAALGFVHGFNIRFGLIDPPDGTDVIMVAPKGPGGLLRELYVQGRGLPAMVAVERDSSGDALKVALAWAAGIGATRAGVIETTFSAETEADLFGEQAVLCGGVTALCEAAFDVLVEAGVEPEVAYLECVHELKQIVDLIYAGGVAHARAAISNTAEYGDRTRGPLLVDETVRKRMRAILSEIRSGAFAREWIEDYRSGLPRLSELRRRRASDPLEKAGRTVRSLMPWL